MIMADVTPSLLSCIDSDSSLIHLLAIWGPSSTITVVHPLSLNTSGASFVIPLVVGVISQTFVVSCSSLVIPYSSIDSISSAIKVGGGVSVATPLLVGAETATLAINDSLQVTTTTIDSCSSSMFSTVLDLAVLGVVVAPPVVRGATSCDATVLYMSPRLDEVATSCSPYSSSAQVGLTQKACSSLFSLVSKLVKFFLFHELLSFLYDGVLKIQAF